MKRLGGNKEVSIPLNAVSLDLRSPAGKTQEGYFRLVVNAISDREGRLRRLGGWRALSLTGPAKEDTFAIIGDQGFGDANQLAVAKLAKSWSPSFIATVGDNIYGLSPSMTPAQANARFVATHTPQYGDFISGAKFYPTIGNHDTDYDPTNPTWYRSKFPYAFKVNGVSKNYYQVRPNGGDVELFVLSSGFTTGMTVFEPDGNSITSAQHTWLKNALLNSTAMFKLVLLHHSPYTNGIAYHPGNTTMRWDFAALGADAVFSGHEHNYERFTVDSIPYIVTGNGGAELRGFTPSSTSGYISGSVQPTPVKFGALRCTVKDHELKIEEVAVDGTVRDTVILSKRINEDLHDQLLTNTCFPVVRVDLGTHQITPMEVTAGSPGNVSSGFEKDIVVTAMSVGGIEVHDVELPTVQVFAMSGSSTSTFTPDPPPVTTPL